MKKIFVLAVLLGVVVLALAGGAWNVFAKTGWCGTVKCEVEPKPWQIGSGGPQGCEATGTCLAGGSGGGFVCPFAESNETVACGVTPPTGTPATRHSPVYFTSGPAAGGQCKLVMTSQQVADMAANANLGLLFSADGKTWEKVAGSVLSGVLTVDCANKVGYFILGAL